MLNYSAQHFQEWFFWLKFHDIQSKDINILDTRLKSTIRRWAVK